MNRLTMFGALIALSLAGRTAEGAPAGTGQSAGQAIAGARVPTAEEIGNRSSRHFAVINDGIQTGITDAAMLGALSKTPEAYDPEHGRLLLRNLSEAVSLARSHAARLQPFVDQKSADALGKLQSGLRDASGLVGQLQEELTAPGKLSAHAQEVSKQLQRTLGPLDDLAGALHSKVDIKAR